MGKVDSSLYMSTQEVADMADEPLRKVQVWAGKGLIPSGCKRGGQWKFRRKDIIKALTKKQFLLKG